MPAPLARGTSGWVKWTCRHLQSSFYLSLEWPDHISRLWPWIDKLHIRTWPVSPEGVPAYQKWSFYVNAFESESIVNIQTDAIERITVPQPLGDDCSSQQLERETKNRKASQFHGPITVILLLRICEETRCSAISERLRCRVRYSFRQK